MAEKKTPCAGATHENSGNDARAEDADERAEVRAAEEAVRLARQTLRKARRRYRQVVGNQPGVLGGLRDLAGEDLSAGKVIDATLELVKKYPGSSIVAAGLAGFFFGRLLRR